MPGRLLDNLINDEVKISVPSWKRIQDPVKLKRLIGMATGTAIPASTISAG